MKSQKPIFYTDAPIKNTFKYAFDKIANILGPLNGKYVLDYGSGTGRSAKLLNDFDANVVGVDIRPDMVEAAKQKYPDIEFALLENNIIPYPDNTFDIVLSSFVHLEINSLDKVKQIEKEIYRVLKPNGIYLILTINPESWGNKYDSFSSELPKDFSGKSGRKVNVNMKTEKGKIQFQDYYWTVNDYAKILELAGFKIHDIIKVKAEKEPQPFLIIKSTKSL